MTTRGRSRPCVGVCGKPPVSEGRPRFSTVGPADPERGGREPDLAKEPSHGGTKPFREDGCAEAEWPVRAAYRSEDGRAEFDWSRLWPHPRADATGRLRP